MGSMVERFLLINDKGGGVGSIKLLGAQKPFSGGVKKLVGNFASVQ